MLHACTCMQIWKLVPLKLLVANPPRKVCLCSVCWYMVYMHVCERDFLKAQVHLMLHECTCTCVQMWKLVPLKLLVANPPRKVCRCCGVCWCACVYACMCARETFLNLKLISCYMHVHVCRCGSWSLSSCSWQILQERFVFVVCAGTWYICMCVRETFSKLKFISCCMNVHVHVCRCGSWSLSSCSWQILQERFVVVCVCLYVCERDFLKA